MKRKLKKNFRDKLECKRANKVVRCQKTKGKDKSK